MFGIRRISVMTLCLLSFAGSVSAQSNDVQQVYIFPISVEQFSGRATIFRTLYTIVNSGEVVAGTLDFYHSNGHNFLTSDIRPPTNGALEFLRFVSFTLEPQNGWARVVLPATARVQLFATLVSLTRIGNDGHEIVSTTTLQAVNPAKKFRSTFARSTPFRNIFGYFPPGGTDSRQTAFAIVNTSSTETNVQLAVLDRGGNAVCSGSIIIPALNRVAKFITELLPTCALPDRGSLVITSDSLIAVGALDFFLPEGRISMVPVVAEN